MKKTLISCISISLLGLGTAYAKPTSVSPVESAAIFKAAGFHPQGKTWKSQCGSGSIELLKDLNQDGQPEALVTDESTMCYGNTGVGYYFLSKNKQGQWKLLFKNMGIAQFLKTTGINKMPDISNGGPGFCFAIYRWNGKSYELNRYEYDGKSCTP